MRTYKIINPEKVLIDHSLQVMLPNGSLNSVNVFEFNLHSCVYQTHPEQWNTIELDDGSWIQFKNLQPIYINEDEAEVSD